MIAVVPDEEEKTLGEKLLDGVHRHSFMSHVFIAVLTDYCEATGEMFVHLCDRLNLKDTKATKITMIVNGQEMEFEPFVKAIDKQLDRLVAEKARDLLLEKMGDVSNAVFEITEAVKRLAVEKLGVDPDR